jgi:hypothetical protein
MNYRDERDALRGRIEGLEQDLQEAKQAQQDEATKRARIEQIEAKMRETEASLEAMRAELASMGGPRESKKMLVPMIVGMGAMLLVGTVAAVFLMLVRTPLPPPPVHVGTPKTPATPAVTQAPIPEIPTNDPLEPPPSPTRQAKVQWTGQITKTNGLGLAPGSRCTIDATLESTGAKQRVPEVAVKCGDKIVYNSKDKLEGMSMSGSGMAEEPGKEAGTFTYALNYSDTGARSGPRTQVTIDTTQKQGIVWSDVIPAFRVEFSVPSLSAPVKGESLKPPKKPGVNDLGF